MTGAGGSFGTWSDDPPVFHLGPVPAGEDVWHQVGNDRLTATAHATGHVVLYSAEAGLVRLSSARPDDDQRRGGTWSWTGPDGVRIASSPDARGGTAWEIGGATWTSRGRGWQVTRRVWAPFGSAQVLHVDVEVVATDPALRGGTFTERWGFAPEPVVLGGLMSPMTRPPRGYPLRRKATWVAAFGAASASRHATLALRRVLAIPLTLRPVAWLDGGVPDVQVVAPRRLPRWLRRRRPSWRAALPAGVVLAALDAPGTVGRVLRAGPRGTQVELATALPADAVSRLSYVVGLAPPGESAASLVQRQRAESWEDTRRQWAAMWDLRCGDPEIERETRWHAAMLRSAQVADACFGTSYVAQGSAYGFVHGLQGAPRDYAAFMVPLCLVDPDGARSMLLTMLHLQDSDGSLRYAHTGYGRATSAGVHAAPTDLPIALLWAAVEYVWTTGDAALLDLVVPWRTDQRPPVTVRERLLLAWQHLRDRVGLGPHGLVRVGSGDWNDPISAMAPSRRAFRARGESVYNSAFAAYVLPRAAQLLAASEGRTASAMTRWADDLRAAVGRAWTGRWFLRAWDGSGGPIGADRLFLDANAWCLVAEVGTPSQRAELVRGIGALLDDPCPIGALSLDRPIDVRGGILAPGWDTNGGVWPALTALLTWGYATHEPERALRLLRKQTLAAHARACPGTWFGIWSGPDAYNAPNAADPGGTYVQPATPMREFPVMNAHAHAGPLLALVRVLGLEAGPDGLAARRPSPLGGWSLSTPLGGFGPPPPPSA